MRKSRQLYKETLQNFSKEELITIILKYKYYNSLIGKALVEENKLHRSPEKLLMI